MRGGINVGGAVHGGGDALGQHARFGVVVDALDFHILKIRPVGALKAPGMAEIVKL